MGQLTAREREILSLIATGHDAKSAARELGLSPNTVYERLRRAREKIGAANSREAVRIFFNQLEKHNEKSIPEKFVLADSLSRPPISHLLEPRATADGYLVDQKQTASYDAASFEFDPPTFDRFLPIRKTGERELQASQTQRLRMIADLTTKLALTFVAICLAAMSLANLIQPG